ncbi:MAG: GMC family oxidoreductase N-terminal domain-containing protein [Rhodospirillales bacterium]|nr:GMC family oxidoreductase N-terminal domain-containing protein [Acetobacter sp.]
MPANAQRAETGQRGADYLARALSRPNLRLITNAMVHRVIFEGKRAVGVECAHAGSHSVPPLDGR